MKILVVGGGGREHSLVWKLAGDSRKPELFCAPGNAGTAAIATNLAIDADNIDGLLDWARIHRPDLTIVGPEAPLCGGLTDAFNEDGLRVFGPNRAAARLEGSKTFAKDVMKAGGVPTAAAAAFTDIADARSYLATVPFPVVIKADGLASGKGVMICNDPTEADAALHQIMVSRAFGNSGSRVLIEEFLVGEEASILALVDGRNILMLASSQDHKRVFNNDEGPNTGGMGAYSPAPVITDDLWPIIREQVYERTLNELQRRGITYRGVLYAGLMMTAQGPRVLEFNCRFGDPETQCVLPRIDGDLIPALEACVNGTLAQVTLRWKTDACVCVVMASGGYPDHYKKGKVIEGLDRVASMDNVIVFHAGTTRGNQDRVVTSGGRVLGVTALGTDLQTAVRKAYRAISHIQFNQAQYRTDIGGRALQRLERH